MSTVNCTLPPALRIIFMGTPAFAVPTLEQLLTNAKHTPPACGGGIKIVAVYTQPPRPAGRGQQLKKSPVHELAEQHNIPVFTPTSLKNPEAQAEFAALNADVAVVVAYGLLLPQAILDAPKYGCINIHPSCLPRWRGAAPIQRTIMAGDKETEICIMRMDAGLDTGDVYIRSAPIPIPETINAGALHDHLAENAAPLLIEVLNQLADGSSRATPQPLEGITYAQKITKEEARIDWSKPAVEIHNHIRGLSPFPGATTLLNGEVLKVYQSKIIPPFMGGHRGEAVSASVVSPPSPPVNGGDVINDHLTITCGDGYALQLLEVQLPGKPRMLADAFLRGHKVAKGERLG